jgi:signal transduction histidine kinase/ligand-binding sensor domain-containing protein/DNA-binding response OmpR family regulator
MRPAAVQSFAAIVLLLLLCCNAAIVVAQADQYKFRRIDVDRGLSHNRIQTFFKDKSGFLWIGTYSGLNRFDGYTIRVFRNDPRDSSSLPDDNIIRLYETPDGRMGVLTYSGLSIYDPKLEKFDNQLDKFYRKYEIPDGQVNDILRDRNNNYWIVHNRAGLILCTNTSQIIHYNRNAPGTLRISSDSVVSVTQDPSGDYWLIHSNGIVDHLSRNKNRIEVIERITTSEQETRREGFKNRILAASDGRIWILMSGRGVYCFDPLTREFVHLHKDAFVRKRLNTNIVSQITEDNKGRIWVSTDHGGVNIVDPKDFSVSYVVSREEDEKSLSQNSITEMYKDSDGIIWLGTFKKGVSYYHESIIRFPLYTHYPLSTNGLPYADVNRFVEDDLGNLWIGTNGGGLIYFDRGANTFKQYRHNPADPNSLSSDVIVSLCIDHTKKLWIGTYYGGLNMFDGKKFVRYSHDPKDPATIAAQNIWEIFEDSGKRLWIGTLEGGLDLLDRRTGQFLHYKKEDINSVRTDYIAAIHEDNEGNIWIGTDRGVDVLSRERGRFVHYESDKSVPGSLSNNSVLDIRQDKAGRIWIGTQAGLNLFEPKTRTFRIITEGDGLPHNTILTILDDSLGNLWLGTPNGLSQVIVNETDGELRLAFKNYDDDDGLQGKQFNENAALRTSRGEMIFGGANGFNIFIPSQLPTNNVIPPVVLSDFYLFNRSIRPGEIVNGINILPASITQLKALTLPADQNDFSIELSAINYFHPEKNKYKYKLEGFHADWIAADPGSRKVTLTNIDPGTYTFRAKASNNDGVWNEDGVALKIVIQPPVYKSNFAIVLYFFLVIGALFLIRTIVQFREKIKFQHEQERHEAIRVHELDMMKLKFFTNVSHEFRTPLTLILTPLEKLLKHPADGEQEKQFQLIQRNAKRLLNLVNQLLDFRKLEVQEIKLRPSEGDIIRFIKETVFSFSDLSEKKDIKLEFLCDIEGLETMFDQDKLEKILFNLLSNAFKFTPEHGAVTVAVRLIDGEQKMITITVTDTGIGIPLDKQEKIFERFFQTELPKSVVNQGSGIGLSITKEFVRVHGGTITVKSDLEKGSTFIVTLPVVDIAKSSSSESVTPLDEVTPEMPAFAGEEQLAHLKGASILLVEDNEDFRFYLKDNLKQEYTIFEARNGAEGWNQVLGHLPDLIISDVMMPQMNGIDLCKKVKTDPRSSHIPVILLTARSAEEQKLEGYESGADEYVTKPFNFEILQSRIHNLIALREKFHKSFPKHFDVKASELKITSLDEKLIQNAIKCVEDNVSNADFSVEDLSRELGISRAHFYKKIMALTGKSPLEFIRTIRLQRAAQLLEKSQLTVAEIAYEVGFNSPKYFARYFKEEYHVLPSAYAASHKRVNGH